MLFGDHIARTFLAQGLQAEGLTKARANLVAANRLVKVDADNKAWQAYLGKLHVSIGDILLTQGQVADALTEYRTMNAIIEPLAAGRWQLDR